MAQSTQAVIAPAAQGARCLEQIREDPEQSPADAARMGIRPEVGKFRQSRAIDLRKERERIVRSIRRPGFAEREAGIACRSG
ncbi:MAG: hypothetical protein LC808_00820 [Actinobacteria bacterium]|nr:hypothetical protein [Actinomycetota bacterium]